MAFFKKTRERMNAMAHSSIGTDSLSQALKIIRDQASLLFSPQQSSSANQETFHEVCERFGLQESDAFQVQKSFLKLSYLLLLAWLLLIIYMIYMFWIGSWHAGLGSFGIGLVILSLAFRYHFWAFQIKTKKLGCTFQEWLNSLRGDK